MGVIFQEKGGSLGKDQRKEEGSEGHKRIREGGWGEVVVTYQRGTVACDAGACTSRWRRNHPHRRHLRIPWM